MNEGFPMWALPPDEEEKVCPVHKSFKKKMAVARSAAIKSGSYVLPSLTVDEAVILIDASPLLAYLRPVARRTSAKK